MRSCCRTAVAIVVLVLVAGIAQGYLKPYEIAPTRANWSSWTSWQEPNTWVGQILTCCWDSMAEVHVFV